MGRLTFASATLACGLALLSGCGTTGSASAPSLSSSGPVDEDVVPANPQSRFKGFYVGQPAAEVPPKLHEAGVFGTQYQGDHLALMLLGGEVTLMQVTYAGKRDDGWLIQDPITLAQAIKKHSLSAAEPPRFALHDNDAGEIIGIRDLANEIIYEVDEVADPQARVKTVYYVSSDTEGNTHEALTDAQHRRLLDAAEVASLPRSLVEIVAPGKYVYASADEASRVVEQKANIVVGRAKRTLALTEQAESWLEIDDDHPEAREVFSKLKYFQSKMGDDLNEMALIASANEGKLSAQAEAAVDRAFALVDRAVARIEMVRAMGYSG